MIPFVKEIDFKYGRADPVSPLIRRVVANNPSPFTYTGTGVYIVGRGEVAVVDPGPDLPDHFEALKAALAGETVRAILVTHSHIDHSPLARPLAALTGASVYGLPAPSGPESSVKLDEANEGDFSPDVIAHDGLRIDGPGWSFEAILTPGHASSHVCYLLGEENALFTGDHIMGWSTTVISPPDGDMATYFASLDKVAARQPSVLWPTHGPPVTDPAPFIAAYRAHRLEREHQVIEQVAAGRGLISEMVPVIYAGVDRRLHPAAAHSVFAHVIKLAADGVIATDGQPTPDKVYRLV